MIYVLLPKHGSIGHYTNLSISVKHNHLQTNSYKQFNNNKILLSLVAAVEFINCGGGKGGAWGCIGVPVAHFWRSKDYKNCAIFLEKGSSLSIFSLFPLCEC